MEYTKIYEKGQKSGYACYVNHGQGQDQTIANVAPMKYWVSYLASN